MSRKQSLYVFSLPFFLGEGKINREIRIQKRALTTLEWMGSITFIICPFCLKSKLNLKTSNSDKQHSTTFNKIQKGHSVLSTYLFVRHFRSTLHSCKTADYLL